MTEETNPKASAIKRARPMSARPALTAPRTERPRLLTVPEVSEILRTSPKAIYSMIERCQIGRVVRIGRRVLFREEDLLQWLDHNCTPSSEAGR